MTPDGDHCSTCGGPLEWQWRFCKQCGTEIAWPHRDGIICSTCGGPLQWYWRHCMRCGHVIVWPHRPDLADTHVDALCTCGKTFCSQLIERLSLRLKHNLQITDEEGANLQ